MGMGVVFAEGMEEKLRELKVPKEAIMCGAVSTRATVSLPPAAMSTPLAPAKSPLPSP
uniref:Uncharacterized protein n=1 Tax=Arundo donax TaxID=35708 RepID=A0A0A9GWW1_ARUDO